MNLGKRIQSLKGKEYIYALRFGRPWDAILQIGKDYASIIDSIFEDISMQDLSNDEMSKIIKYSMYTMSNYGNDSVYYDYDDKESLFTDYRENLKLNGYYLPDEINTEEWLLDGKDIEDGSGFPDTVYDEQYGELRLARDYHDIMSETDMCVDVSLRIENADDLSIFMEVCYMTFVDLYKGYSHQEELEAVKYAPYTLFTDYISTILFTISDEVMGDIIKMYATKFQEFTPYLIYDGPLVYEYPPSILECVERDEIGMLFVYNYKDMDELNLVLTCICMMFKTYLEKRVVI